MEMSLNLTDSASISEIKSPVNMKDQLKLDLDKLTVCLTQRQEKISNRSRDKKTNELSGSHKGLNTSRVAHYEKRLLLSESFDMNYPRERDSDSDTDVASSNWLNTDNKPEYLIHVEDSDRDITIDDDLSFISNTQPESKPIEGIRSKTAGNHKMMMEDSSLSQMISTSFLDEIKSEGNSFNKEYRKSHQEFEHQVKLQSLGDAKNFGTFQEPLLKKLELTETPRYWEHDVYYIFQYHFIEHPIDWLFLHEEPHILIELLNDQQAIYANKTLTVITDTMPETEIMPWYFAFKGMLSLFVSQFDKAFEYFEKAFDKQENILFMFWKIIAKFYQWYQCRNFEDFSVLKLLTSRFEVLSQFNVNIKWIILQIRLYEYMDMDKSDFWLNNAKDSACEIRSINPYLGSIAIAEIYAAVGKHEKCIEYLEGWISSEPDKVHAYVRLYANIKKFKVHASIIDHFVYLYTHVKDMRENLDSHCEIRYRLVSLLYIKVAALEGQLNDALNTIWDQYQEDPDKLSILMEFARIVTKNGSTRYVGEAMGVLEEIEMRGWIERNRDVYFLMAQIEILRGNIMIGYKLFMEALNHLNSRQDKTRIEYINSFILAYKKNILKAIEFEKIIELGQTLSIKEFEKALKDLSLIECIDKRYSDIIKLKLYSLFIEEPCELLLMINEVYTQRKSDIKLTIYFFDMAFTHKDLVVMVQLRDEVLGLIDSNETISTCEYVNALDLVYRTYSFQGKYKQALEILDKINEIVPALPESYDLNTMRKKFTDSKIKSDKISFRSFSDPRYHYEKGKLWCRIVLDYHANLKANKSWDDLPDLISFEDSQNDKAMQSLACRSYNELLEEGLSSLVEYLLNLFYRKQYYQTEEFEKLREKAFFWVSATLFKLKRYEESLDLIKRYYHNWDHSQGFVNSMVSDMFDVCPSLKGKYMQM